MADTLRVLHDADLVLSKCGRPVPPAGYTWVDIPGHLFYTRLLPVNVAALNMLDQIANPSPTVFLWRGFSGVGPIGSLRFKLPSGRFLQSAQSSDFGNEGSQRSTLLPEALIPPRQNVQVTLQANTTGEFSPTLVTLMLHGVFRWLLDAAGNYVPYNPTIPTAPRYLGTPNQNIMVPEYLTDAGVCAVPIVDAGTTPESSTIFSGPITVAVTAGAPTPATVEVIIPRDGDFILRALDFDTESTGTAAGTSTMLIELPDGRSLTNGDLLDLDALRGPVFPEIRLTAGSRVKLTVSAAVDATGTGNLVTIAQLDGWRLAR